MMYLCAFESFSLTVLQCQRFSSCDSNHFIYHWRMAQANSMHFQLVNQINIRMTVIYKFKVHNLVFVVVCFPSIHFLGRFLLEHEIRIFSAHFSVSFSLFPSLFLARVSSKRKRTSCFDLVYIVLRRPFATTKKNQRSIFPNWNVFIFAARLIVK